MDFAYTVESQKPFGATREAVARAAEELGFRVLHTHDVSGLLAEKGFRREPLQIIEVCNAGYAQEALAKDIRLALMLPCPIAVYAEGRKVLVGTLETSSLAPLFPKANLEPMMAEVQARLHEIVNRAAQ